MLNDYLRCLDCKEPMPDISPDWSHVGERYACPKCGLLMELIGDDYWNGEDEYSMFELERAE